MSHGLIPTMINLPTRWWNFAFIDGQFKLFPYSLALVEKKIMVENHPCTP